LIELFQLKQMGDKPKSLTEKQKIFCREYIYDWNATRAAKIAGYSEETAYAIGAENLRKPQIQAYITEIQKDLEKVAGISRLRIVQEHINIVNTSIAHLHNTWLTRKEFDDLTEDQKSAIQEISTKATTEKDAFGNPVSHEYIKIKLYDRQKSMDSLTKMLGYNEAEKLELSGSVKSYKIVPASSRNRVND
jgi:phage terminase small subunit